MRILEVCQRLSRLLLTSRRSSAYRNVPNLALSSLSPRKFSATAIAPRSAIPEKSSEDTFKLSKHRSHSDVTESVEAYHPGGLCPIELGNTLDGGSYKVIRKLGFGSDSTVWLAEDNLWRAEDKE
jgi:hypothetical protein